MGLITTVELAQLLGLKPRSIRQQLYKTGSYYGITPVRLPNGRLMWPSDTVERLVKTDK